MVDVLDWEGAKSGRKPAQFARCGTKASWENDIPSLNRHDTAKCVLPAGFYICQSGSRCPHRDETCPRWHSWAGLPTLTLVQTMYGKKKSVKEHNKWTDNSPNNSKQYTSKINIPPKFVPVTSKKIRTDFGYWLKVIAHFCALTPEHSGAVLCPLNENPCVKRKKKKIDMLKD